MIDGLEGGLVQSLAVAAALTFASFAVHAAFISTGAVVVRGAVQGRGPFRFVRETAIIFVLGILLVTAHALTIGLWGLAFEALMPFATLEETVYFTAASYTTLGYGDLLPAPEWSLLAGAVAANGLLLFGFSAAFMFDAYIRLHIARW